MAIKSLSAGAVKAIHRALDQLFDRAKARYLGPNVLPRSRALYVYFRPEFSLPGMFMNAAKEERAIPNKQTVETLIETAGNYIDSYRAATKAQVTHKIQSFLTEADVKGIDTDLKTVLGGELANTWGKVTGDIRRLVDTENTTARNMGTLEGIMGVSASLGEEDPVVFWVVVRDQHLCSECKKLHLLSDGITPRVWRLSEVGHGYHKKGEKDPKIGGLHPNCRCSMVYLAKGYGFDGSGMIKYISPDHDEYQNQR